MTDEKLLGFAKMDLESYQNRFSGIISLPFGGSLLKLLKKMYVGQPPQVSLPKGYKRKETLLVLTERYPNQNDPYRNGFVHRRVKAYEQMGVHAAVFCMDMEKEPEEYAFDGVPVTVGQRFQLYAYLRQNPQIKTVFVHFLNRTMWDVLKEFPDRKFVIWSHGYDILPMHHRMFLYPTKAEKAFGKAQSEKREAFWNEIFSLVSDKKYDMRFIFVSEYLRSLVQNDYTLAKYPSLKTDVIPNCIDTGLFAYEPKSREQRLKLLSVRPFESANYANDLTVKAIGLLAKEPFFDQLEILIAGDGKLFDSTVKPLKKYKNVTLHKGFYKQPELAKLYREYGIALLPTRFDTQGVSRDEAFSSGMAVITTDCAAVPEFADSSCAVLTPPEDAKAIAAAVKRLYESPEEFLRLSKAARERVLSLSPTATAAKELRFLESEK